MLKSFKKKNQGNKQIANKIPLKHHQFGDIYIIFRFFSGAVYKKVSDWKTSIVINFNV